MFLRKFKWYRNLCKFYQRGKKGYCDEDLWDLYDWFTGIFPKMLEEFINNSQGYPADGCPPKDVDGEIWYKEQQRKWHYEVKKLIWFLKEANDFTCSQKNEIEFDVNFDFVKTDFNDFWSELKITYPTEEDEQKSKKHFERSKEIAVYKKECFNKALKQFEKISRNLWD